MSYKLGEKVLITCGDTMRKGADWQSEGIVKKITPKGFVDVEYKAPHWGKPITERFDTQGRKYPDRYKVSKTRLNKLEGVE